MKKNYDWHKMDLEGKMVLIKKECFKPEFQDERYRVAKVLNGFGMRPWAHGKAITVNFHYDDETTRYSRHDVECVLEEE